MKTKASKIYKTESHKIVRCAGGIVKDDKKRIVLVWMNDVCVWDFPKGGIEKNENEIEAAVREIYEETGLKNIKFIKKLENYIRVAANGRPVLMDISMFLFITKQKKLLPVGIDIQKAKWVEKENILENLTLSESRKYFKKIINNI